MKAAAVTAAIALAAPGLWSTTIGGHRITCGGKGAISCSDRSRQRGPAWAFAYAAASKMSALAIRGTPGAAQRLVATHDGGRSWEAVQSPCRGQTSSMQGLALPTTARGWLLCVGQPAAGNQVKAVDVTTDLGAHWRAVVGTGLTAGGYAQGISFLRNGHGILWESRGTLFVTNDGGREWVAKRAVVRPEVDSGLWAETVPPRFALELLASPSAYRLLVSSDSGQSWRTLHAWRR